MIKEIILKELQDMLTNEMARAKSIKIKSDRTFKLKTYSKKSIEKMIDALEN